VLNRTSGLVYLHTYLHTYCFNVRKLALYFYIPGLLYIRYWWVYREERQLSPWCYLYR